MARRSRRDVPDAEDYIPEEDEFEEEEEEDRPRRRKRRSRRDAEDEEPPRRKRRSSRRDEEDDEEEEEDRPRRRSRRTRDEEDEDEAPRRRRRSRDEDDESEDDYDDEDDDFEEEDEAPRRSRRRSRDDDDDEEPRRSKKRPTNRNSGWGGYQKVKSETSSYADKLQVTKIRGEAIVKFLDAAPFCSYALHWFDEMPRKKGWMCLESIGEERCPGCDAGDRPMPKALFNIVVFDDDGDPTVKVLDAGTRLTGQLEKLSEVKGGLTGHYWSVTAGPKGSGTGNFQRIKERDLEEDYDILPLTDEELEEFEEDRHVLADVEQVPSYKDFRDAIRDIEE